MLKLRGEERRGERQVTSPSCKPPESRLRNDRDDKVHWIETVLVVKSDFYRSRDAGQIGSFH